MTRHDPREPTADTGVDPAQTGTPDDAPPQVEADQAQVDLNTTEWDEE